jgi:membrane-bound lytic murein transglycosylase B
MRRCYLAAGLCVCLCACLRAAAATTPHPFDVQRADIKAFVAMMIASHAYDGAALQNILGAAQSQQSIIDAMSRPAEKTKPWFEYRAQFITERRIAEGAAFWIEHHNDLETAAAKANVEPEILVAILGVETFYGRRMGHFRVIDALATLAFDYPPRAKFFAGELEQFLLLVREDGVDALGAQGSYAGAMGAPQFMPTSYRRFGVDAAADGHVDLWSNWPDVFASVAKYFHESGWRAGEPVFSEASIAAEKTKNLDGHKVALNATVASLRDKGFEFETALPASAPAEIIAIDQADGVHWRIGYKNFYVITRYNRSPLYAMAVAELAEAVKTRVFAPPPVAP